MGWRYEWVGELPQDVYEVLLDMVKREAAERQHGTDS